MAQKYTCDIIIPIYNAYEDFKLCIESIMKHTLNIDYRLVLIDDKSPDERIGKYLQELEEQNNSTIIVLRNEVNKGFVKTVNAGITYSDNDVVLLNTDTIVTNNWLEKIVNCAYSDEKIATVTPFTNKGVVCSVPNVFSDNEVPEGFDIDRFAEFVEKISVKAYPEITTGVGFCMFIKRKMFDEIGKFDEELFEKGYAEENDFCLRAFEHGCQNVLADDTYIYHKGTMSFKDEERIKFSEINLEKLHKIYPYYVLDKTDNLENIVYKNTIENIKELYHFYKKGVKNILYIADNNDRGVAEETKKYTLDLIIKNKKDNIVELVSNGKQLILKSYSKGEFINEHRYKLNKPIKSYTFNDKSYYELVENIVKVYNINLIHVEQLINHTFDIVDIAKENQIPIYSTLHEFNMNSDYVGTTNLNKNLLDKLRDKYEKVLKEMDKIIDEKIYSKTDEITNKSKYIRKILFTAGSYRIEEATSDAFDRINALECELNLIKNGTWWRIREKLERDHNRLFKLIRKILKTIVRDSGKKKNNYNIVSYNCNKSICIYDAN